MALTIATLVFVGARLIATWDTVHTVFAEPAFLALVGAGALAYVGASTLLALAWSRLLRTGGGSNISHRTAVLTYAITQVFKYLPGNVFHVAGRWVAARQGGARTASVAWATTAEIVLLASAAGGLAVVFAAPTLIDLATPGVAAVAVLLLLAALVVGAPFAIRSIGGEKGPGGIAATVGTAWALYAAFLALNGGLLWLLLQAQGEGATGLWDIVGLFAAAWLAGFLTPGSPAGLGVREAVLLAALPALGAGAPLAAILGYRVVSLVGDVSFAALAYAVSRFAGEGAAAPSARPR